MACYCKNTLAMLITKKDKPTPPTPTEPWDEYGVAIQALRSTGTQYIDTGIKMNEGNGVWCKYKSNGQGKDGTAMFGMSWWSSQDVVTLETNFVRWGSKSNYMSTKAFTPAIAEAAYNEYELQDGVYKKNGVVISTVTDYATLVGENTMFISAQNYPQGVRSISAGDYAGFKIYGLFDGQPIKLTKKAYGSYPIGSYLMWDKITNTIPVHYGIWEGVE